MNPFKMIKTKAFEKIYYKYQNAYISLTLHTTPLVSY